MSHTYTILLIFIFLTLSFSFHGFCLETDIVSSSSSFRDPDFLVSSGRVFILGFFTPQNTTDRYLAIYYVVSERTIMWVANRDNPLTDSYGTVTVSADGSLVLTDGQNRTIWSTDATSSSPANSTAQILDSGNLVLRESPSGKIIWDSFSNPSNTFVPTMKLTHDMSTGRKVRISSWRSTRDPRDGRFTAGLQAAANGISQIFTWRDNIPHYRSGPWNGILLIGIQDMYSPYLDGFQVGNDSGNVFFMAPPKRFLMKIELNTSGSLVKSLWDDQTRSWDAMWVAPRQVCDVYGTCGPFGICNPLRSPVCSCLPGFDPADRDEWGIGNWTGGCVRRTGLRCGGAGRDDDRFLRLPFMKVPDFAERFPGGAIEECRVRCLRSCWCLGYSYDQNIGCMVWREALVDMQQFNGVGPDFHLRLAASELDNNNDKRLIIIIPVVVAFAFLSICILIALCWMAKRKEKRIKEQKALEALQIESSVIVLKDESEKVNIQELPLFTFKTLADATNQYHVENMLGMGGFGHVYKGRLGNEKEIAVKRLSTASGQGMEEFMNEAIVISKVQHRNLVKLLGCCIERGEKMLVYEYMPNRSLDICLFDPKHPSQIILDWKKRFSIIEGIGRGLVYLHTDSRLKIIHRDLKPSNVLLDEDYNPKISDFGMARIVGGNQNQGNTARVVGTYGYMAPEYAMDGHFSEKSDVYSFGVLVLEIVSGKKNTHFYDREWCLSLLGCAWKLWRENNGAAFADRTMVDPIFQGEIVRCIHIALLCVQENSRDRPSVQAVLSMLSREIVDLPPPLQPVFAEKWNRSHAGLTPPTDQPELSVNGLTITALRGR